METVFWVIVTIVVLGVHVHIYKLYETQRGASTHTHSARYK